MTDTPQLLLAHHLKALKLPTFLREYDKLARQCAAEGLDHIRFLLRLAELELIERERRMVERRIKEARFPAVKSLDSFDFAAIPSLNKTLVLELARSMRISAIAGNRNIAVRDPAPARGTKEHMCRGHSSARLLPMSCDRPLETVRETAGCRSERLIDANHAAARHSRALGNENQLHYTRDVSYAEAHRASRKAAASRACAASLTKSCGSIIPTSRPRPLRRRARRPQIHLSINQSITNPTFTRRIEEKASERRSGFSLEFFASCAWTKRPCF